ncbi:hypothetical protein BJX63DRAFT_430251 [Aspergillus granulosus]|uniref:Uncharacterized protein n=1 Tax=Aspergillus granulosus TaxID=176169 RepID=A0ABR4HM59_9EURO
MRTGEMEDSARLACVGKNIHSMKSRLMEGLVPLDENRWGDKGLNDPDKFEVACEYLTAVGAVFEYLSIPHTMVNMRDTFNLIEGHLGDIQRALNARRKTVLPDLPDLNLSALWEEYMRAVYSIMTSTAHSWILDRITKLKQQTLDMLIGIKNLPVGKAIAQMEHVEQRWAALTHITFMADIRPWLSMNGYKGFQPLDILPGLHNPKLDDLMVGYQLRYQELLALRLQQVDNAQNKSGEVSLKALISANTAVQDALRLEIRGQPAVALRDLPPAPWIQLLLHNREQLDQQGLDGKLYQFGFAIYRTAYNISDEDWEWVKKKVEEHVAAWGEGISGAEEVKPLLKLYWFDCKELGLDPRDNQAAKNHFLTLHEQDPYAMTLDQKTFLVLDAWAAVSYTTPEVHEPYQTTKGNLPGDFQSHLLAIDANYDPTLPPYSRTDECPGYTGHMRILGNLVFSDLYAMVARNLASIWDLWPLAMEHPQNIYTGPVAPTQLNE